MPSGRRTPLLVVSAGIAATCGASPLLTWLTADGRAGHCGWTCYVPLSSSSHPAPVRIASVAGRSGAGVAPALSVLLVLVALLAVVVLLLGLRAGGAPALLGRITTVAAFAALIWTVVVIVRYAEGGSLVRTSSDGVFAANLGVGAIVALAGSSGALLLGGAIAVGSAWTVELGRPGRAARPSHPAPAGERDRGRQPSGDAGRALRD